MPRAMYLNSTRAAGGAESRAHGPPLAYPRDARRRARGRLSDSRARVCDDVPLSRAAESRGGRWPRPAHERSTTWQDAIGLHSSRSKRKSSAGPGPPESARSARRGGTRRPRSKRLPRRRRKARTLPVGTRRASRRTTDGAMCRSPRSRCEVLRDPAPSAGAGARRTGRCPGGRGHRRTTCGGPAPTWPEGHDSARRATAASCPRSFSDAAQCRPHSAYLRSQVVAS